MLLFPSAAPCFCAATLVDVVGSAALVTLSDRGGVSLAIHTLYLNPMPGAAANASMLLLRHFAVVEKSTTWW
jgi:hypothetical protein